MHGNVFEWCADWYGEELSGGVDPADPAQGISRVGRGGAWDPSRGYVVPSLRIYNLGFRPALVPSR